MKSTPRLLGLAVALSIAGAAGAADQKRVEEIVNSKCGLCHGVQGESANRNFPRLAGQRSNYTRTQLKQFGKRERTNDNAIMHSIAAKLTELEIRALAEHISGLDG